MLRNILLSLQHKSKTSWSTLLSTRQCKNCIHAFIYENSLSFIGLFQVVLDVEGPPDLLRALVPHHVGHLAAGDVQQPLDVQVVGSQDQIEQGLLVNLKKELSMKSFMLLCKHTC